MWNQIDRCVWMAVLTVVGATGAMSVAQEQLDDPLVPRPAAIQRVAPKPPSAPTPPEVEEKKKIETAEDVELPAEIIMEPEEGQQGRWTHLQEKKIDGVKLSMNNINTSTSVNINNGQTSHSCNLSGRIFLPGKLPIVHITQAHLDKITDAEGKDLPVPRQYDNWDHFNSGNVSMSSSSRERQHYFYCNLHGITEMPEQLGLIEMRMKIFLAKKFKTHDMKIDIMDTADKVTDGLLMRITDVDPQTNQYKLTVEQTSWAAKGQPAMLTKIELIDDAGTVIPGSRWSSSSSSRDGRRVSTDQYGFNLPEGSMADKVRVHFADEFVVHTLKVKLKNVAVP